ncbi:MAG: hypothetical protein ABR559_08650 [Gemmatimonadota bacterium]
MITGRAAAGLLALILTAGAGGCRGEAGAPETGAEAEDSLNPGGSDAAQRSPRAPSDERSVVDYVGLVGALQAAGLEVEPAGPVTQPFFQPQGELVRVNGADLQVFQYPDSTSAAAAAATVSADGGAIGTTMVNWTTPPRFHRAGPLVVIELGGDEPTRATLAALFGPPFAGRVEAVEP